MRHRIARMWNLFGEELCLVVVISVLIVIGTLFVDWAASDRRERMKLPLNVHVVICENGICRTEVGTCTGTMEEIYDCLDRDTTD